MTAWPEQRRGGLWAAAAARAESWLLAPAAALPAARVERELPPRAVVAVVGLGPRCGATTIARALAVELARRDPSGAAIVSSASVPGAAGLATGAARRLTRALGGGSPAGRLALLEDGDPGLRRLASDRPAPLVLDVGHGTPPEPALALADRAVLVASPEVEPALAEVAAAALARGAAGPLLVLNRAPDAGGWRTVPDARVGESRVGARLALAGREPFGALGAAAAALADACAEATVHA
jgi:hypothetical protein